MGLIVMFSSMYIFILYVIPILSFSATFGPSSCPFMTQIVAHVVSFCSWRSLFHFSTVMESEDKLNFGDSYQIEEKVVEDIVREEDSGNVGERHYLHTDKCLST